jgi:hypothetical protein
MALGNEQFSDINEDTKHLKLNISLWTCLYKIICHELGSLTHTAPPFSLDI